MMGPSWLWLLLLLLLFLVQNIARKSRRYFIIGMWNVAEALPLSGLDSCYYLYYILQAEAKAEAKA